MIYDIAGHALLTGAAKSLDASGTLTSYVEVAEEMLGIAEPKFTDTKDVRDIENALAMQVSLLATAGTDFFLHTTKSRGSRMESNRGPAEILHPIAAQIVDKVNSANGRSGRVDASQWKRLTTLRPTTDSGSGSISGAKDVIPGHSR